MHCGSKLIYDTAGFCFTVVSSSHSVSVVQQEMMNFVKEIPELVRNISADRYSGLISSILNEKKTSDISIWDNAMRFWDEILERRYQFENLDEEIRYLQTTPPSVDELLFFCSEIFSFRIEGQARLLVVQCHQPQISMKPKKQQKKLDMISLPKKTVLLNNPEDLRVVV